MSLCEEYGPWAVITGASEGVGAEFALRLADEDIASVLVARREAPLAELAGQVRGKGVACITAAVDLTVADATARIADAAGDREVGLLIANAGADTNSSLFLDTDPANWERLINLNILTTMRNCHHFGQGMRARGRGGMILVGSGAGYGGLHGMGVYCGVKAFDLCFGEGLWAEMRHVGVDVLNLILGRTDTPAHRRIAEVNGRSFDNTGMASAEDVARTGLEQLPRGPTHNWGQTNDVAGYAPNSPDDRRARIMAIEQLTAADLGCAHISVGPMQMPPQFNPLGYPHWSLKDDPAYARELNAVLTDRGVSISLGEGFAVRPGVAMRERGAEMDMMAELGTRWLGAPGSGLRIGGEFYSIDAKNTLGSLNPSVISTYTTNPDLYTYNVTAPQFAALLATSTNGAALATQQPASNFAIIVDTRTTNLNAAKIEGIDFHLFWDKDLSNGHLGMGVSGTLQTKAFITNGGVSSDQLGRGSPKFFATTFVGWEQGRVSARMTVNISGRFRDGAVNNVGIVEDVRQFVVANLNLGYNFKDSDGPLDGTSFRAIVDNLFEATPQTIKRVNTNNLSYNNFTLGRVIKLGLSKKF